MHRSELKMDVTLQGYLQDLRQAGIAVAIPACPYALQLFLFWHITGRERLKLVGSDAAQR